MSGCTHSFPLRVPCAAALLAGMLLACGVGAGQSASLMPAPTLYIVFFVLSLAVNDHTGCTCCYFTRGLGLQARGTASRS